MKAVILASGSGTRLKPLTDTIPKCLVRVGDETLIDRQIRILSELGVTYFVITTGCFRDELEAHMAPLQSKLNIEFVYNERFLTTNYIYSLWLARDKIDEDILLLHADLFFAASVAEKIMKADVQDAVLVDKTVALPPKDFKAKIVHDRVRAIAIDIFGSDCHFCAPFYRLSRSLAMQWLDKIGDFVMASNTAVYAENALNEILHDQNLKPVYFDAQVCMEIDTLEDLQVANDQLTRANV